MQLIYTYLLFIIIWVNPYSIIFVNHQFAILNITYYICVFKYNITYVIIRPLYRYLCNVLNSQ